MLHSSCYWPYCLLFIVHSIWRMKRWSLIRQMKWQHSQLTKRRYGMPYRTVPYRTVPLTVLLRTVLHYIDVPCACMLWLGLLRLDLTCIELFYRAALCCALPSYCFLDNIFKLTFDFDFTHTYITSNALTYTCTVAWESTSYIKFECTEVFNNLLIILYYFITQAGPAKTTSVRLPGAEVPLYSTYCVVLYCIVLCWAGLYWTELNRIGIYRLCSDILT
jgi:hypothetical protein